MVDKKLFSTGLGSLIVSLLVIGLVFRFANLDKKVYWIDEVNTSIRVSAYTSSEIMELVPTGEVIGVKDLQTFQHLHPERDIRDGRLISLSYLLDDKVRIMLIEPYSIPDIPQGFKPVFVFKPLQKWFSDMKVEHNINIKLTHQVGDLWIVQPIILFSNLT